MRATDVVGYTADADVWCCACAALVYDRKGEDGILRTVADDRWPPFDSEGNEVHPIFASDEAGDTPDHCNRCGELIDNSWSGATVEYAESAVREYLATGEGNYYVLAEWIEHAHPWAGFDADLAETFLRAGNEV